MKTLSFLTLIVLTIAISFLQVRADDNSYFDQVKMLANGVRSTVIQCGDDPDGNWYCVETNYDDGSNCLIIDNEGAPSGVQFFNCE